MTTILKQIDSFIERHKKDSYDHDVFVTYNPKNSFGEKNIIECFFIPRVHSCHSDNLINFSMNAWRISKGAHNDCASTTLDGLELNLEDPFKWTYQDFIDYVKTICKLGLVKEDTIIGEWPPITYLVMGQSFKTEDEAKKAQKYFQIRSMIEPVQEVDAVIKRMIQNKDALIKLLKDM